MGLAGVDPAQGLAVHLLLVGDEAPGHAGGGPGPDEEGALEGARVEARAEGELVDVAAPDPGREAERGEGEERQGVVEPGEGEGDEEARLGGPAHPLPVTDGVPEPGFLGPGDVDPDHVVEDAEAQGPGLEEEPAEKNREGGRVQQDVPHF